MLPEALIFDVDGTLAETEEVHRRAFNDTFAAFGLDWHWSREDYRVLLRTTGGKERMRAYAGTLGMEIDDTRVADIHARKTGYYGELIAGGDIDLRPGIAELLDLARANGVRLAIATTTNLPNVDALIGAAMGGPACDFFEAIAAGDQVAAKKPAPDVYLLALERLALPASSCLALEDSRNGLISARAAGVATFVSPSLYTWGEDFTGAAMMRDDHTGLTAGDLARCMAVTVKQEEAEA